MAKKVVYARKLFGKSNGYRIYDSLAQVIADRDPGVDVTVWRGEVEIIGTLQWTVVPNIPPTENPAVTVVLVPGKPVDSK